MPAKKKKANQQQLQTQRAPQRQLSPVLLFSKRARTWIVAATGETETSLMPSAGDAETMFAAALAWAQGIL